MLFHRTTPAAPIDAVPDAPVGRAGDHIAGFRLVRKLGAGPRAEVWLGHAAEDQTAALKLYRSGAVPESIDTEIHALSVAEHAHVVQLRDLSAVSGGLPCVILERLPLGSLSRVLATRRELAVGEAVTILAPVIAAIGALHESGVVHGNLSASAVLFRESGAPVLACFGHAATIAAGASAVYLAESPLVEADRRALAALCCAVLERVPEARQLARWLAALEQFPDAFEQRLAERIFALGGATPVQFAHETAQSSALPARLLTAEPVAEPLLPPAEPWYAPFLARMPAQVLARLPRSLPAVRRPVWIAAALSVALLLVGLAVVPGGTPAAPPPTETPAPLVLAKDSVTDDDPVAGFEALVVARDGCIRSLSVLCLDSVDQAGSAAMDDDLALIRSIEHGSGGESFVASAVALIERDGDAALVSYETSLNDKPASALLVKNEAGWRIRTYLEG